MLYGKRNFFLNNKGSLCYKNSFFLILSAMSSQPITWSNWSGKLKTTPTKPWPWRARLLLKEAAAAASAAPWYKSLWESTFQQVLTIIRSLPGYSAKVWGVLCSFKCISSKKDTRMSMLLWRKADAFKTGRKMSVTLVKFQFWFRDCVFVDMVPSVVFKGCEHTHLVAWSV